MPDHFDGRYSVQFLPIVESVRGKTRMETSSLAAIRDVRMVRAGTNGLVINAKCKFGEVVFRLGLCPSKPLLA